jgi:hypothetical protein
VSEVRLSADGGVATRLITALAALKDQMAPGTFSLIGGLAGMARLQRVHRGTDGIDAVSEQLGDEPSDIDAIFAVDANAYCSRPGPRLVDGVEVLASALHPDRSRAVGCSISTASRRPTAGHQSVTRRQA